MVGLGPRVLKSEKRDLPTTGGLTQTLWPEVENAKRREIPLAALRGNPSGAEVRSKTWTSPRTNLFELEKRDTRAMFDVNGLSEMT